MYITITEWDFIETFRTSQYKDNFTAKGLIALFEYLENLEEKKELDIVAIACEYRQIDTALEITEEYNDFEVKDLGGMLDAAEADALKYLEDNTVVIKVQGGGIIIAEF